MSPRETPTDPGTEIPPPARTAAAVSGFQAFLMAGAGLVFALELLQGEADDTGAASMTLVVALIFAALLTVLAVHWWRGARWPRTPTIVWNLLMLPAAWSLTTSSGPGVGIPFGIVALVGLFSAGATPPPDRSERTL